MKHSSLIGYHELSEEWQAEARSNNDEYAEEATYFEPEEEHNPEEHVLWDLNDATRASGSHEGFIYNAVIGISNNSAMLLNVSDDAESVEYIIV